MDNNTVINITSIAAMTLLAGSNITVLTIYYKEKAKNDKLMKGISTAERALIQLRNITNTLYGDISAINTKVALVKKAVRTDNIEEYKRKNMENSGQNIRVPHLESVFVPSTTAPEEFVEETVAIEPAKYDTGRIENLEAQIAQHYEEPTPKEISVRQQVQSIFSPEEYGRLNYPRIGPGNNFKVKGPAIKKNGGRNV